MQDEIRAQSRYSHVAVRFDHCIIVLGGKWLESEPPLLLRTIWMYNVYTEEWGMYQISDNEEVPPPTDAACAVVIGSDIFMFGGRELFRERAQRRLSRLTNALWKLSWTPQHRFLWSHIKYENKLKPPTPRADHSGWEYANKLWIFFGRGVPSDDYYLHDHGEFTRHCVNNQLLCFDPSCMEWQNLQCFGDLPGPIEGHATAILGGKVWMFGGYETDRSDDVCLRHLDMNSLIWMNIQTTEPKPSMRIYGSLTVIGNTQLVLHGKYEDYIGKDMSDTWIFDLSSVSWRKFTGTVEENPVRSCNTCTPGINNSAIIIGGWYYGLRARDPLMNVHVMLEPKSLQQIAMKTVYKNKTTLSCEVLPRKLRSLLRVL